MHEGHRQRMLERLKRDAAGLQDHELLEILLYFSVPRVNTNFTAHELISAFGSLEGVLGGTYEQFLTVKGVGPKTAEQLCCLSNICKRLKLGEVALPEVFNYRTFRAYLEKRFFNMKREVVELYFLDKQERIRFMKQFASQYADKASVDPEELSSLIVAQKPYGLVIVHNHPYANAEPSGKDDEFTAQIQLLCSFNHVEFYDHIIMGIGEPYSYFICGRLEFFKKKYSIANIAQRKELP